MKNIFLFLLILSVQLTAQSNQTTTIYLVRHAEKVTTDPNDKDPELSKDGTQRTKSLMKKFKKIKLSAIYSSSYKRTILSAKSVAENKKLEISYYDPKQLGQLATNIRQKNIGQNILIVGHSNTLLETIESLGGKTPITIIEDNDYHYFFILTIHPNDSIDVKVEHYGKTKFKK